MTGLYFPEEEEVKMELENKEFKVQDDPFNDNHIALIHKHHCWSGWWINKD